MRRIRLVVSAAVAAAALVVALPATAGAAVDMFLKLDGIPGETNDEQFQGATDVLAYSWGASNTTGRARPSFQDLSVTKYLDSTSPVLLSRLASGQTIPSAQLSVRKAGEHPNVITRICLTNVSVHAISGGGSGGEDRLTENVTFGYGTFTEAYIPMNDDGTPAPAIVSGWDLVHNIQYGSDGC
jgi:type VI secretion system secreted protein Hcp